MVNPAKIFKSKSLPRPIETTFTDKDKSKTILTWMVRPLSPRMMVQNYKHFAGIEDLGTDTNIKITKKQEIATLEKLSPLIDIILPFCCLDPKIVMEGPTNDKQINIDDLDVQTLMALFTEIFKTSGMSEEKDEERKNLKSLPTPKQ